MASSTGTQSDVKSALTPTSPSFQAGGQPPSSTSWSARPGDPSLNSPMDGNTGNPAPQLSPFHNFNPGSAKKALARPERFRTDAPPLSTQPQLQFNGLSSPFSSRPQSDGFSTPFSSQAETDGFSTPFIATATRIEQRAHLIVALILASEPFLETGPCRSEAAREALAQNSSRQTMLGLPQVSRASRKNSLIPGSHLRSIKVGNKIIV